MPAGSRLNSDPESGVHRLNFLRWEIGLSLSLKMCRPVPNADLLNVAHLPARCCFATPVGEADVHFVWPNKQR
jgi:hypothetical protein